MRGMHCRVSTWPNNPLCVNGYCSFGRSKLHSLGGHRRRRGFVGDVYARQRLRCIYPCRREHHLHHWERHRWCLLFGKRGGYVSGRRRLSLLLCESVKCGSHCFRKRTLRPPIVLDRASVRSMRKFPVCDGCVSGDVGPTETNVACIACFGAFWLACPITSSACKGCKMRPLLGVPIVFQ